MRVLIVGGGIAGMAAAIGLRQAGVATDLIDIDPAWRVYGAGITITGPTLRALRTLGVLDAVLAQGHAAIGFRTCAVDGTVLAEIDPPGVDGLGTGGILRPVLHSILSQRTLALGTNVRLGVTVRSLTEQADGVDAVLSDGTIACYDAVIGADGVASGVRNLVFPDAPEPAFTGQACWRLMTTRPPEIDRRTYFLGGPVKVGLTPVSATEMYMFLLERVADDAFVPETEQPSRLATLLTGYGGVLSTIRAGLSDQSLIVYRPLKSMLLPPPWHAGRVAIAGDAAHATTPQLASGAGMALEDGIVLAQELTRDGPVPAALARYTARRFERCRMVVENSLELGRMEVAGATAQAQTALLEASLRVLAEPI